MTNKKKHLKFLNIDANVFTLFAVVESSNKLEPLSAIQFKVGKVCQAPTV